MVEEIFITVPSDKATPAEIADFMSKLYIRDIQRIGRDNSAHAGKTAKAGHTSGVGDHTHQSAGAEGGLTDHGFAHTPASLGDDDHTQYARSNDPAIASLTDNTAGTANDTLQAVPDPADAPVSADALRDDLVANALPAIRNDFADLAAKVNAILTALRSRRVILT